MKIKITVDREYWEKLFEGYVLAYTEDSYDIAAILPELSKPVGKSKGTQSGARRGVK